MSVLGVEAAGLSGQDGDAAVDEALSHPGWSQVGVLFGRRHLEFTDQDLTRESTKYLARMNNHEAFISNLNF